ncbi:hypothetical protein L0V05_12585 [Tabrizicola sp. J26]|uniref:hypothetical protein n=1 Tax=Alitabrizicola rongguiensis TaxID=2909234 RepID=UPI001F37C43A|nr:hypothetical protein [Tabrizicola rongguiensis]MCF1709650.1 hypothetical protein [Tabrizicola rongguiensis]
MTGRATAFPVGLAIALAGLLLGEAAAAKPGTPGPDYFTGTYQRIGRSGGAEPGLIDDKVAIAPDGDRVTIRGCTGPETLMGFGPAFEIVNLMTGQQAGIGVECLFHNNGYNRPILTCQTQDGAAWTLWPTSFGGPGAPLVCG